MKYCTHCGKELSDEAAICIGCGCPVKAEDIELTKKISAFVKNKKQWIIAFSIIFVVFTLITVLILTSDGFVRTIDEYQYKHSSLGTLGVRIGGESELRVWQSEVEYLKSKLVCYYVAIGVCGLLSATSFVGDIILILKKSKK